MFDIEKIDLKNLNKANFFSSYSFSFARIKVTRQLKMLEKFKIITWNN